MVFRCNNTTGTILLNVLLGSGMMLERVGINNLLLVCVANPPIYQVLPRVIILGADTLTF
jgi:hypothetical protein